jgi:hypothetical protein
MDDLEEPVPAKHLQLQIASSNGSLLVQTEPQEDGKDGEDDGVDGRRKDTLDDTYRSSTDQKTCLLRIPQPMMLTNNSRRQSTDPGQPTRLRTQGIDVGNRSDESQERCPDDDQPDSQ